MKENCPVNSNELKMIQVHKDSGENSSPSLVFKILRTSIHNAVLESSISQNFEVNTSKVADRVTSAIPFDSNPEDKCELKPTVLDDFTQQDNSVSPVEYEELGSLVICEDSNSPVQRNDSDSPVQRYGPDSLIKRETSISPVQREDFYLTVQHQDSTTQRDSILPVQRKNSDLHGQRQNSNPFVQSGITDSPNQRGESQAPVQHEDSKSPAECKDSDSRIQRQDSDSPVQREDSNSSKYVKADIPFNNQVSSTAIKSKGTINYELRRSPRITALLGKPKIEIAPVPEKRKRTETSITRGPVCKKHKESNADPSAGTIAKFQAKLKRAITSGPVCKKRKRSDDNTSAKAVAKLPVKCKEIITSGPVCEKGKADDDPSARVIARLQAKCQKNFTSAGVKAAKYAKKVKKILKKIVSCAPAEKEISVNVPAKNKRGRPRKINGQPQNISKRSQNVSGELRKISGQLQNISGWSRMINGQPQNISKRSQNVCGELQKISGQFQNISGGSRKKNGQPQNISERSQNVSGELQKISGQLQNINRWSQDISGWSRNISGWSRNTSEQSDDLTMVRLKSMLIPNTQNSYLSSAVDSVSTNQMILPKFANIDTSHVLTSLIRQRLVSSNLPFNKPITLVFTKGFDISQQLKSTQLSSDTTSEDNLMYRYYFKKIKDDLSYLAKKYHMLDLTTLDNCYGATNCNLHKTESLLADIISGREVMFSSGVSENNVFNFNCTIQHLSRKPCISQEESSWFGLYDGDTLCRNVIVESMNVLYDEEAVLA